MQVLVKSYRSVVFRIIRIKIYFEKTLEKREQRRKKKNMKRLSKDEIKDLTASALLEVVAAVVPKPIGVVLPVIGNTILSAKNTIELNERFDSLEESQQKLIKEELEKIYDVHIRRQENSCTEMYSIDVVEMFFREELSFDELREMNKALEYYCSNEGLSYDNEFFCNSDTCALVDSYYIYSDSVIFNLDVPSIREDVQELVNDIDEILKIETSLNQIKKMNFY